MTPLWPAARKKGGSLKTSKTNLLPVAKDRLKEHVDAAERQRTTGNAAEVAGKLTFAEAMGDREQLAAAYSSERKGLTAKPG